MLIYKTIKLKKVKDFVYAEKLKATGYKIVSVGIDNILMEKEKGAKNGN
jgi:hypothetical protein